ncbi:YrdB family protein [Telluribacter sp.]|jgi:hypothetical protein|uniref:YrdB family protein n=1 Tax=Telluribacter sp. TaxID=1978767 RepID=UPI002E0F21A2|nr:YrdB family protein [Telluribacter sp.]
MSQHPINLGVRFLLEILVLVALGTWGWQKPEGTSLRYGLALLLQVVAATVWGVFRVPNDPGVSPVQVPGLVRLLLEILFFWAAVAALYDLNQFRNSLVLGVVLLVHYLLSYDRVLLLLRQYAFQPSAGKVAIAVVGMLRFIPGEINLVLVR